MDEDFTKELNRKAIHLGVGLVSSALIYFEIAKWWHFLIMLIIFFVLIVYLKDKTRRIPILSDIIDSAGREKEYPGLGAFTFIVGIFFSSLIFEKNIAAASITILAVGDAVSPIIGKYFGKIKIKWISEHKKIEGFFAGVILSFLAATPLVGYKLAFFGSFFGMLAEIWDKTNVIDDNILMPLVAGGVMSALMII